MIDLNDYVHETVLRALQVELPGEDGAELRQRAEGLVAIAERAGVRIESLLAWIHTRAPEKEWSLAEFRGCCAVIAAVRQEEAAEGGRRG